MRQLEVGIGAIPQPGQTAAVHYTIWLRDGSRVDSSLDRGTPFLYRGGQGSVIEGFEEGVASMRVGGRRRLIIPPISPMEIVGAGAGKIPPHARLICDVELIAVE